MIRILQIGEGNFLRTFADAYFDTLNKSGFGPYEVYAVKPRAGGSLEAFARQKNRYHIVLRGCEGGSASEQVQTVEVLKSVFSPFEEPERFFALARDPELQLILSNTTEAGIRFDAQDDPEQFEAITWPARLTLFLLERFCAGLPGVHLLPAELIDGNGDELRRCMELYARLWELPEEFQHWLTAENVFCNTLVDRIVSGPPKTAAQRARLEELAGEPDALLSVGEPFGLWAVENKGRIAALLPQGGCGIRVELTDDIAACKKRKVRVLNGSHTNLVPAGLLLGMDTVYDCMQSPALRRFAEETLREEIVPFVSADTAGNTAFAAAVLERFANPYLEHALTSIALNSISKWRARVLPTVQDYLAARGSLPPHLMTGFACLMALYARARKTPQGYEAAVGAKRIPLQDDPAVLSWFAAGGSVLDFLKKQELWGEDLTALPGFAAAVEENLARIAAGEVPV